MTDSADTPRTPPLRTAREAYGFACLACGHAWEQTYDIEHHLDSDDRPFYLYYTAGRRVPSPLNRLTCRQCGEHNVRVVRAGQASAVHSALGRGWPPLRD
ncbi:hypothetical protein V1J52_14965 [Streptomyces sp. TRM 70351]|uniref:hypothetical protein n=1 Tax=Streptomyces sp. TRM 70351 TaxID=3116552 RepID=UPI002E7BF8B5|nr:hypothetical protein [Streptomyces sp. TRM 70351]MEE1929468.1 hypothetical protein [Streptomyces sp. TRM 70351]